MDKAFLRPLWKEDKTNYLVPCYDLANAIERNKVHTEERIIKEIYQIYKDKNIDCIVLGCTHYPLIKELIGGIFKDIPMVDGSVGVAKRVKYLLEEKNKYILLGIFGCGQFILFLILKLYFFGSFNNKINNGTETNVPNNVK